MNEQEEKIKVWISQQFKIEIGEFLLEPAQLKFNNVPSIRSSQFRQWKDDDSQFKECPASTFCQEVIYAKAWVRFFCCTCSTRQDLAKKPGNRQKLAALIKERYPKVTDLREAVKKNTFKIIKYPPKKPPFMEFDVEPNGGNNTHNDYNPVASRSMIINSHTEGTLLMVESPEIHFGGKTGIGGSSNVQIIRPGCKESEVSEIKEIINRMQTPKPKLGRPVNASELDNQTGSLDDLVIRVQSMYVVMIANLDLITILDVNLFQVSKPAPEEYTIWRDQHFRLPDCPLWSTLCARLIELNQVKNSSCALCKVKYCLGHDEAMEQIKAIVDKVYPDDEAIEKAFKENKNQAFRNQQFKGRGELLIRFPGGDIETMEENWQPLHPYQDVAGVIKQIETLYLVKQTAVNDIDRQQAEQTSEGGEDDMARNKNIFHIEAGTEKPYSIGRLPIAEAREMAARKLIEVREAGSMARVKLYKKDKGEQWRLVDFAEVYKALKTKQQTTKKKPSRPSGYTRKHKYVIEDKDFTAQEFYTIHEACVRAWQLWQEQGRPFTVTRKSDGRTIELKRIVAARIEDLIEQGKAPKEIGRWCYIKFNDGTLPEVFKSTHIKQIQKAWEEAQKIINQHGAGSFYFIAPKPSIKEVYQGHLEPETTGKDSPVPADTTGRTVAADKGEKDAGPAQEKRYWRFFHTDSGKVEFIVHRGDEGAVRKHYQESVDHTKEPIEIFIEVWLIDAKGNRLERKDSQSLVVLKPQEVGEKVVAQLDTPATGTTELTEENTDNYKAQIGMAVYDLGLVPLEAAKEKFEELVRKLVEEGKIRACALYRNEESEPIERYVPSDIEAKIAELDRETQKEAEALDIEETETTETVPGESFTAVLGSQEFPLEGKNPEAAKEAFWKLLETATHEFKTALLKKNGEPDYSYTLTQEEHNALQVRIKAAADGKPASDDQNPEPGSEPFIKPELESISKMVPASLEQLLESRIPDEKLEALKNSPQNVASFFFSLARQQSDGEANGNPRNKWHRLKINGIYSDLGWSKDDAKQIADKYNQIAAGIAELESENIPRLELEIAYHNMARILSRILQTSKQE